MKYAADLASCIWKALGLVLRLIHTDYAKYYIAGHWKTGPKGLPARGATLPPHTHTLQKHGGAGSPASPRVPTPMNFSKHLTGWLGASTVELCGWKKRDLGGILRYVWAQEWGGGRPPSAPPPWKVGGGEHPPCPPPCSYAYELICFKLSLTTGENNCANWSTMGISYLDLTVEKSRSQTSVSSDDKSSRLM